MSSSLIRIDMRGVIRALALVLFSAAAACGPSSGATPDGGGGGGGDGGGSCVEGTNQCTAQNFQTCQNGQWVTSESCTPPSFCNATSGCIECFPNTNYCDGNDVYMCNADGTKGGLVEQCTDGKQCGDGVCRDLCADAAANNSYIGCEYWAVDLDNAVEVLAPYDAITCPLLYGGTQVKNVKVCANGAGTLQGLCDPRDTCTSGGYTCQTMDICGLDAQHSPFAVVVSNPQTFDVSVTISNGAGTTSTVSVPAGQVSKIFPQMSGFADQLTDETEQASKAYKIASTAPIVAYQFNPLDNANVFSNDGSLLIPRTTFDKKYYGLTWPTLNRRNVAAGGTPKNDYNGYVVVVAWQDDTQIRVTPKGNIRQGETMDAIPAGTPTDFTLNAFDVLELEADNTTAAPEQDLTGTLIEGLNDKSFGVFGGHEAIVIQNTATSCCADHIEEMMFPASTWGKDYAVARSQSRGKGEPDVLRVLAQEDGTTISFNPAPSAGSCPTLNAGDFCEVRIQGDTEVSGDKPILVGHYLMSVIVAAGDLGDPALALAVPTEQFRESYTFLVPSEYAQQYVSVVAGAGTSVQLDSGDVTSQLATFGSGAFKAARISVQPGQHKVTCPGGCGIEVYGYDDAVSYLFAGGLDLKTIVVN